MVHVPVSPADSRTDIPLNPSWPIMLQTLLAYFSGTVWAIVLVNTNQQTDWRLTKSGSYLFVVSIGVGNDIWQRAVWL